MATYTVSDLMVQQAPQIGPMINQKIMGRPTPWITLGRKETWADQTSSVQKTFQFDRAMLTSALGAQYAEEVEWANVATDVTLNDAEANHLSGTGDGLPPADTVEFTETLRDYRLQHKAVWGPPMNTNNLRDKFVRVKQMDACTTALADQGRELQINRGRSEYTRIADNLVVLDSAFSLTGGKYGSMGFPVPSGAAHTDASILTNGFTDIMYEFLNHQGAAGDSLGMAGGSAGYSLVTSPRQSRRLIMADPDVREDFRYSSQNEGLLAAMGKKWSYNGFVHTCDEKVNRWEYMNEATKYVTIAAPVGTADGILSTNASIATELAALPNSPTRFYKGTQIVSAAGDVYIVTGVASVAGGPSSTMQYYVRLATGAAVTVKTATTAGFKAWLSIPQFYVTTVTAGDGNSRLKRIPNPGWLNATWEDSYIYHQGVCTTLVPTPITSVGKANFPAVNYAGSYRWTNYEHRDDNPDGSIGQFRGIWSNGTRPDNPEFGIVIRHLAVPSPDGRIMDGSSLG
jgi:hypothetical protein